MKRAKANSILIPSLACLFVFAGALTLRISAQSTPEQDSGVRDGADVFSAQAYSGSPFLEIHDNIPFFTEEEKGMTESFESYSELDEYGRCGVAYANIGIETLPTEERGPIGHIKPSGWHTVKYPDIIEDMYLYNRCHLIAYCLAGENDNEKNLITGTHYMNVEGMLPFEERTVRYVERTHNHVLYRVTPKFYGDNPVADGVLMEAYSLEDDGEGICFCVFVYNVQPGIVIDYTTGESAEAAEIR